MNTKLFSALLLVCFTLVSCGKGNSSSGSSSSEVAQQVGDAMASVDEAGGDSGTLSMLEDSHQKLFARLAPDSFLDSIFSKTLPNAYAGSCALGGTFGTCSTATKIRTFSGCTIGAASFNGTVTFTWGNGAACTLSGTGDTITRVPNFTVTGLRGATLSVQKSGTIGQRLTQTGGSGATKVFSFTNDGIRRVFTSSGGILFDFTTTTTSAITLIGTNRNSSRSMSGGALRVTNNQSGTTCDYAPSGVTWSSTCNCATSGTWTSTCSDGLTSTLTLTGCGTASFALGTSTESINFDRCYGI